MASVVNDPGGFKRIIYKVHGKRYVMRLGEVDQEFARDFADKVKTLTVCQNSPELLSIDILRWAAGLPDNKYRQLVKAGLLPERENTARKPITIDGFLAKVFSALNVKPSTLVNYGQARRNLIEFFTKDQAIEDMTAERLDQFRAWLCGEVSQATMARRIVSCRQFFKYAVKWGYWPANLFEGVRGGSQRNSKRQAYVDDATIQKVVDACPDNQWRLIVLMARYEGVRIPSEIYPLRWGDVDWEGCRLTVHAPKTEHHDGKEYRVTPIFPEVMPTLRAVYDEAPEGSEFIITRYRAENKNLRTQFERIVKRAGVKQWPKLFQNLRASRETELFDEYPIKTACEWIGNNPKTALEHYIMNHKKDAHFQKAVAGTKAAQNCARGSGEVGENGDKNAGDESGKTTQNTGENEVLKGDRLGVPRLAHPSKTRAPEAKDKSGAKTGAPTPMDELLKQLIAKGWRPPE
jgi:integrase